MRRDSDVVLKVSRTTEPGKLARSIEMTAREQGGTVLIRAMGEAAVNRTVKALIMARSNIIERAQDLAWTAGFDEKIEDGERINLIVFKAVIVG